VRTKGQVDRHRSSNDNEMLVENLFSIPTPFYLLFVYHGNIHPHSVKEEIPSVYLTIIETDMSLSLSCEVINIYMYIP